MSRFSMWKFSIPLLLSILSFAGCNEDTVATCNQATQAVSDCLASPNPDEGFADCERKIAQADGLCGSEKADIASTLCDAGVLRFCPEPACEQVALDEVATCAEYIDVDGCASCDYYLCKEAEDEDLLGESCGPDGYYLFYGHKYCTLLTQLTRPHLSPAGQAWLDKTRTCLMESIEYRLPEGSSCDEVQEFAFDSHPDCYVDAGFCSLPASDIIDLLSSIDVTDRDLRQVVLTAAACVAELFE